MESDMGLEDLTGTNKFIDDLVIGNPVGSTDTKSTLDDHIKGVKNVLNNCFEFITGKVTASHTELNVLDGITANTAELNTLDGISSTTAELNLLSGKSLASSDDVIDNFPAGTVMLFYQAAAPTGWTKDLTASLNNNALRILTTGTWTSGSKGTVDFSTVFAKTATDSHTLVEAEIPAHTHGSAGNHSHSMTLSNKWGNNEGSSSGWGYDSSTAGSSANSTATAGAHTHSSVGGNGGHSHNMDIRVKYVDLILASKD